MSKNKKLLKSIETKEKAIKEALDNVTASDFSKEGKEEMIEEVGSMINKLEGWKVTLRDDALTKKAS